MPFLGILALQSGASLKVLPRVDQVQVVFHFFLAMGEASKTLVVLARLLASTNGARSLTDPPFLSKASSVKGRLRAISG